MTRILRLDALTGVGRLVETLERPAPLLAAWGALLVSESQRAFRDQRFGEFAWPARYEGRKDPFLNLAAALAEWNRGGKPRARHFQRRPALIGQGGTGLRGSIASRVVGTDTVEVGSELPYASLHQRGGGTSMPITATAKKAVAKWLRTKRGAPFRDSIGFLFRRDTLNTFLHRRPFVGITDRGQDRVRAALETFVVEGAA